MNKNVIAVFAAVCGLFMVSCGTPSDLRPSAKVSTETVPPGHRHTYNVSDLGNAPEAAEHGEAHAAPHHEEVMPNHDMGANTVQPGDSINEKAETNTEAGAVRH